MSREKNPLANSSKTIIKSNRTSSRLITNRITTMHINNSAMASPHGRPPRSSSASNGNSSSPIPTLGSDMSRSCNSQNDIIDFQMMDITVGVDIMEGLVMEITKQKGRSPLGTAPITAVISCKQNVSSSRQISTHVPSLPLSVPSSSFSDKEHNFLVRWPADFDPRGDALSTFKMSRLMKRDTTQPVGPRFTSEYAAEQIELSIGLLRGAEMLVVGKASLIITGNETEDMIIDLPINNEKDVVKDKKRDASPSPLKRTNSKLFSKSTKNSVKILKPLSFPSDKRRKFHLTNNAMIRLQVHVCPRVGGNSLDESGVVSNPASYLDAGVKSKETAYTEYTSGGDFSSREDSRAESLGSADSSTEQIQNQPYNPIQPHKYHPHIPMDELQQDFGRVRLTNDMKKHIGTHASYGMAPPYAHSSKRNMSSGTHRAFENEMPRYTHQDRQAPQMGVRSSNKTRSSSSGRVFGNEMPHYTQQNLQAPQMLSRPSSRLVPSNNGRVIGNEMSHYTQQASQMRARSSSNSRSNGYHTSGVPRSSKPQRTEAAHSKSREGYYQPKNTSRNREHDHYQQRQKSYAPQTYSSSNSGPYGDFVPRGSSDFHMQESENGRSYHAEGRRQRTLPRKTQSQSRSEDNGDMSDSPMTWLYDKIIGGKVPSAEETVITKRKSNGKKQLSSNEYRRPSPKRTMRV